MRKANKILTWHSIMILVFAFLLVFYYVFPRPVVLGINCFVIIFSLNFKYMSFLTMPQKRYGIFSLNHKYMSFLTVPIKWYGIFAFYVMIVSIIRDTNLVYVSSCFNVLFVIYTIQLLIRNKFDLSLFIKGTTFAGFILCLFLFYRYGYLLGMGRFGMELPGTRIESAITLGYIMLYIMCVQIYQMFQKQNVFFVIITALFVLISIILTVYTGTRKAMILPFVLIFTFIAIRYRSKILKLLVSISTVAVFTFAIFNFFVDNNLINDKELVRLEGLVAIFGNDEELDDSTIERITHIEDATKLFVDNPIFGSGIDKTLRVMGKHAHNNYMSLLAFGGIVMFCLYYWVYLYIFRLRKRFIKANIYLFLIVVLILPLSDLGTTSFNILYFNVLIAILLLTNEFSKQELYININKKIEEKNIDGKYKIVDE